MPTSVDTPKKNTKTNSDARKTVLSIFSPCLCLSHPQQYAIHGNEHHNHAKKHSHGKKNVNNCKDEPQHSVWICAPPRKICWQLFRQRPSNTTAPQTMASHYLAVPLAAALLLAFRLLLCDLSLVGLPLVCYPLSNHHSGILYYRKYVALSFDRYPAGGGLRHVEDKYLRPLLLLSRMTGRIPIFPPPHVCLEGIHNGNRSISRDDDWTAYYDTQAGSQPLPFVGLPDGFSYLGDGKLSVDSSMYSSVHHSAKTPFHMGLFEKIDPQTDMAHDVVVFDSFSPHPWKGMDAAVRHLELRGDLGLVPSPLPAAPVYRELAALVSGTLFGGRPFLFVHVRRGDYLQKFRVAACTSPASVSRRIRLTGLTDVFIATNEKSPTYIPSIQALLPGHSILSEKHALPQLPDPLRTNNYKLFLFLDCLASLSKINVATREKRLGNTVNFFMCKK